MKNLLLFGLALAMVFATVPARAQDDSNVSFQDFYNQLSNDGSWIQTNDYGYVFQPQENDPNWQPYSNGHWVYTDQGWTWASYDPWGWATDHYGRWVNLEGVGWAWVPGYVWGPAWVSWRYGDGYCGWAPLPPDTELGIDFGGGFFGFDFGYHLGDDCDTAYGIGPGCYNFCPVQYLGDSNYRGHYANRYDNYRLINHTRNVTDINVGRAGSGGRFGRVHDGGPSFAEVNAHSHSHVQQAQLTEASGAGDARLHGTSLAVYSPAIENGTIRSSRPSDVSSRLSRTRVNRGTNIDDPLAVNSRLSPGRPTAAQIRAAHASPASRGVATANTHFSRALNRPLVSMEPDARGTETANASVGARNFPAYTGSPAFTGESVREQHDESRPVGASVFTGEEPSTTHHKAETHTSSGGLAGFFHHESAPTHHETETHSSSGSSLSKFFHHESAPSHHDSVPEHHESMSSHHESFSAPHFSGGGHSGGGGGGGHSGGSHPSSGGGHASSGGGHSGGGGGGKKK
jgi:hypothetical protein